MSMELSLSDDYASVFQQQIRSFREKLDLESKSGATQEDRISELPNNVLCHILSFVQSTKDVVRTSVLSTRWKNVWAHVPNLYFYDDEFSSSAAFIAFVDRVLLVHDSSTIERFQLHFNNCCAEHFAKIDGWISAAVRCNVVELDLSINPEVHETFELPISLLTCKTLKVMFLRLIFIISIPTSVIFPSLKCLYIHLNIFEPEVDVYDDQVTVNYRRDIYMNLFHVPVLEFLSIDGDLGSSLLDFYISAPELKTLRIDLYSSNDLNYLYNFTVDAPKLENLDLHECSLSNFNFPNTKSLVKANIKLYMHCNEDYLTEDIIKCATECLAVISTVKYLSLSWTIYQACSVPVFGNLSKLTICSDGSHWWKALMKLLDRSPILECLEIDDGFYPTREDMEAEVMKVPERNEEVIELTDREAVVIDLTKYAKVLNWIPPESVPNCLLSSLKTISIKGFMGKGYIGYLDEMALTKYLLNNCQVLEKLTIYTPGLHRDTKGEICNEISMCEQGSKNVHVELIEKMFYRGERLCD